MSEHHPADPAVPTAGVPTAGNHIHSHVHDGKLTEGGHAHLDGLPHRSAIKLPPELDDPVVR